MKTSLTLARFHLLSVWNWRTSHLSRVIEAPAYFLFMVTGLSTPVAARSGPRPTPSTPPPRCPKKLPH